MRQYNYGYSNELYHHGILGQRWGVRRYQNKDGTLTPAGKRRLKEDGSFKTDKEYKKEMSDTRMNLRNTYDKKYGVSEAYNKTDKFVDDVEKYEKALDEADSLQRRSLNDVDREMRKKYGLDYDNFVKSEQKTGEAVVVGGLAITVATTYVTYKGLKIGAKALINVGAKAVEKMLK